ncbi:hypothetical protein GE107_10725 [Cohnella sp. CFH 77786]|uniref:hypothetical protein n=1 Tax=Cohnella sp. CFH 77786 TaxID=2662265 RepID=UPI001C60A1D9|nr:hypothetical protein [Cohnella sp. CFH 77786]MBW5446532.1 hypothetical protein [Cohnella sp. CFH 77786]
MKNSIYKYLYYLGSGQLVCFVVYMIVTTNPFQKTQYTLLVYESPASNENKVKGLEDPNHKINGYAFGVPGLGIPDKRINLLTTPLYVLIKQKNQEIIFVTDDIKGLNDYLMNER